MSKEKMEQLTIDEAPYVTNFTKKFLNRRRYVAKDPKKVLAHIPGVIQRIHVVEGQEVKWGERLLVLEAMKMKNDIAAPLDGVIKAVHIRAGDMVAKDQLLVEIA